jgi:acetamidase/formamidase
MTVRLEAGAGTVHWGYLDAALAPALSIDSGDTVTISTVSGPPDMLPPPPAVVPQALYDIHNARTRRMLPGHMCTGPVAVRGARPGQMLQVDIEDIALHYDWGYTAIRPLKGALPHDFPEPRMIHVALERRGRGQVRTARTGHLRQLSRCVEGGFIGSHPLPEV